MADLRAGDVSRQAFQVAYYGGDPNDHVMDVEALAPALLAFGQLIREANAQINGDRAKVKVLVTSDFEHKCFNINFEVIQNIIEAIKSLFQGDKIQSAEKFLEALGIIGGAATISLFAFLKIKNGRRVTNVQRTQDTDSSGDVIVNINVEGDNNTIHVPNQVLKLSENKKILQTLNETLGPIESGNAERIEFRQADRPMASYDRDDTRAIVRSCDAGPGDLVALDVAAPKPDIVTASLYVYSPVFDNKARSWRFNYKRKHIYADISETSIARDAMKRGGSFTNDRYRVRMEVTPPDADGGEPHFKILQVLDFTEAQQQAALPLPKPKAKAKKRR
jgi:hypothetical protein